MSKDDPCLHCMILEQVKLWAEITGKAEGDVHHADGRVIVECIVQAAMDVLDMAPQSERQPLYLYLIDTVFEAGERVGIVKRTSQNQVKPTIN
jgi:hypothetical protein